MGNKELSNLKEIKNESDVCTAFIYLFLGSFFIASILDIFIEGSNLIHSVILSGIFIIIAITEKRYLDTKYYTTKKFEELEKKFIKNNW